MPEGDGSEPIADDEILYRRIPVTSGWYDPDSEHPVAPEAFRPNRNDHNGLSLWRAKYKSIREAAQGRPDKSYYVALLSAGDLRSHGIEVAPEAQDGGPGHAAIPALNASSRREARVKELARLIATELCRQVEGPFLFGNESGDHVPNR